MIASIRGSLQSRDGGRIVVECAGVGYEIFIPQSTFANLPQLGAQVALEVRQVVREDSLALYGFLSAAEKRAFDLLMHVQNVGPKLALAVLSTLATDELVTAIARNDVNRLDAVPGVGAKVAERIVRELRDKTAELKSISSAPGARAEHANGAAPGSTFEDAVSALVNLGYKELEARRAIDAVLESDGDGDLGAIIRRALASLSMDR